MKVLRVKSPNEERIFSLVVSLQVISSRPHFGKQKKKKQNLKNVVAKKIIKIISSYDKDTVIILF